MSSEKCCDSGFGLDVTMNEDPRADLVPVKDVSASNSSDRLLVQAGLSSASQLALEERDAVSRHQRLIVAKLSREDLEDRYFHLLEENGVLKKHGRKQEDKIKKLATKLVRMISEQKKQSNRWHDPEKEAALEEAQQQLMELEQQNRTLRERVLVLQQQLTAKQDLSAQVPYRVSGRSASAGSCTVASGVVSRTGGYGRQQRATGNKLAQGGNKGNNAGVQVSQHALKLLEEARKENQHLQKNVQELQEQMRMYEQELDQAREQMRLREMEHEEELVSVRERMSNRQQEALVEDMNLIRLQREAKGSSAKAAALQVECRQLETALKMERAQSEEVKRELDEVSREVQEEKKTNSELKKEIRDGSFVKQAVRELQQQVQDLQKDNQLLRQTNEKLLGTAFDAEREKQHQASEDKLKVQIAQLEATVKSDLRERSSLLEQLEKEHKKAQASDVKVRECERHIMELQETKEKLEEQLLPLKPSVTEEITPLVISIGGKPSFIRSTMENKGDDKEEKKKLELTQLKAQFLEAAEELEKTRQLLRVQHSINQDCKAEISSLTQRLSESQREQVIRLKEYGKLLELRAGRIRQLESSQSNSRQQDSSCTVLSTLQVGKGQGLFELQLRSVSITPEAQKAVGDSSPRLFATWAFLGRDLQYTPVVEGPRALFSTSCVYQVELDDYLRDFLNKGDTTIELHMAVGPDDCCTIASGPIHFSELLSFPTNRLHGVASLFGVRQGEQNILFATAEYSFRLQASEVWWQVPDQTQASVGTSSTILTSLPTLLAPTVSLLPGEKALMNGEEHRVSPVPPDIFPRTLAPPAPKPPPRRKVQPILNMTSHTEKGIKEDQTTGNSEDGHGDVKRDNSRTPTKISKQSPQRIVPNVMEEHPGRGDAVETNVTKVESEMEAIITAADRKLEAAMNTSESKSKAVITKQMLVQSKQEASVTGVESKTEAVITVVESKSETTVSGVENEMEDKTVVKQRSQDLLEKQVSEETINTEDMESDYEDDTMFEDDNDDDTEEQLEEEESSKYIDGNKSTKSETVFAEVHHEPSSDNSEINSSSDSEGVVIASAPSKRKTAKDERDNFTVIIGIGYLTLKKNASVMRKRPSMIAGLFVEFHFLDLPPEETETPFALPLPKSPEQRLHFNFEIVVSLDPKQYPKRRRMLGNILHPDAGELRFVRFTIVSEPPEADESMENQDVGFADMDLHRVLQEGKDLEDHILPVKDSEGDRDIGTLSITFKAVAALRSIRDEFLVHS